MSFRSVKHRVKYRLPETNNIGCIYSSISIYRKSLSTKRLYVNNSIAVPEDKKHYTSTNLSVRVSKCLKYLYNEDTKTVISMKTLIIKSLPTSLFQREEVYPLFGKEEKGEICR